MCRPGRVKRRGTSEPELGEGQVADRVARADRARPVLQLDQSLGPGEPGDAPRALGGEDLDRAVGGRAAPAGTRGGPARFAFAKAAGSAGRAAAARAPRRAEERRAGRRSSVQTKAATGLPGSPNTGRPPQRPSASGRPGFTAMRQVSSAPARLQERRDMVLVPGRGAAGGQDRVGLAAPRSSAAATASAVVGRVAEVDRLHLPAPQELERASAGWRRRSGAAPRRRRPARISSPVESTATRSRRRTGSSASPTAAASARSCGAEPAARRQDLGARRRRPRRPRGCWRRASGRARSAIVPPSSADVLVEHHGVDARRQQRPGQDPQRVRPAGTAPANGAPAAARPGTSGSACGPAPRLAWAKP